MNIKNLPIGHLVTVNNDSDGQTFLKVLRRILKDTPKCITVYGRGYRYGRGNYHKTDRTVDGETVRKFDNRFQSSLPQSKSQRLSVYVRPRPTFRYKKVTKTVTEYVRVPTKWGETVS